MDDDNLCRDCNERCPENWQRLQPRLEWECEREDKNIYSNGTIRCYVPKDPLSSTSSPQVTYGPSSDNEGRFADNEGTISDNDRTIADDEELYSDNEGMITE